MNKEKQLLLDEVKDQIVRSGSFVIAGYSKLDANKANEFRREMRKIGGNFEVVRKRIFVKALETEGLKFDIEALPGHIGLIFASQDAIETTKTVLKFSDKNEGTFALIGGRIDGQFVSQEDVKKLASLPSKDQMRAELLGLFEAPMSQTLAVMEALLSSVCFCLDNKANEAQ